MINHKNSAKSDYPEEKVLLCFRHSSATEVSKLVFRSFS